MSKLDGVWRVEVSGIEREVAVTVTAADQRTVTVDGRVIVAGRRWCVGRAAPAVAGTGGPGEAGYAGCVCEVAPSGSGGSSTGA